MEANQPNKEIKLDQGGDLNKNLETSQKSGRIGVGRDTVRSRVRNSARTVRSYRVRTD